MRVVTGNATFKKPYFDGKIYDENGNLVTVGISSVAPSVIVNCPVVSSNVINCGAGHGLVQGDDIMTSGSTGIPRSNTVQYAGEENIEVEENIEPYDSTHVTVHKNFHVITLSNVPDGFYYFSDQEALLVTQTALSIFITYTQLQQSYKDLTRNTNITSLNNEAMDKVLSEFDITFKMFKKIAMSKIKTLKTYAMLCMTIENEDKRRYYCKEFTRLAGTVMTTIEKDNDGKIDPNPLDDDFPNKNDLWSIGVDWSET